MTGSNRLHLVVLDGRYTFGGMATVFFACFYFFFDIGKSVFV
jgi:hypothetical protein